jgi:predicted dehydrogenase
MGDYYANNLVNKCGVPADQVVAHDRVAERAQALQQKYGIIAAEEFPTGVDTAIVATNTPSHHEVVVRLAQDGIKNILVEKPLAQTPEGVSFITKAAHGAKIYTALVINFSPAIQRLLEHMEREQAFLLEFYGRWGKNRGAATEKRPTAGDLEDEAVHPIGVVLALATYRARFESARVSAEVGYLPYVNEAAQAAARALDSSFPARPNHSTSANIQLHADNYHGAGFCKIQGHVHSSFLLAQETRMVGGLIGSPETGPVYAFELLFDQKRPEKTGGAVDVLKLVHIRANSANMEELQGDKLNDLTRAFLEAARGGKEDQRLARLGEAGALVKIAQAILDSGIQNGALVDIDL